MNHMAAADGVLNEVIGGDHSPASFVTSTGTHGVMLVPNMHAFTQSEVNAEPRRRMTSLPPPR